MHLTDNELETLLKSLTSQSAAQGELDWIQSGYPTEALRDQAAREIERIREKVQREIDAREVRRRAQDKREGARRVRVALAKMRWEGE